MPARSGPLVGKAPTAPPLGQMARSKADKLITAEQVAEMTGLSAKTIYAGKAGTEVLLRVQVGKRGIRWSRNSVQGWIDARIKSAREAERQAELQAQPEPKNVLRFISRAEINRIVDGVRNESTECQPTSHENTSNAPEAKSGVKALSRRANVAQRPRARNTAKINGSASGDAGSLIILRRRRC